jgi:tight adherence protein C
MNQAWLIGAAGFCVIFTVVSGFVLLTMSAREKRLNARVKLSQGIGPVVQEKREGFAEQLWARSVSLLGQIVLRTGLLSSRTRAELETTLQAAGLRNAAGLEIFIGSKLIAALVLPLVVNLPDPIKILLLVVAGVAGLLSPDMIVKHRRNAYMSSVEKGLPDALDLLVICSQAGLGLTAAIARVAEEMQAGGEAIGLEMALTSNELQFVETRTALLNLGTRTGVRGLVRLGTTLVQSMQYGTPLTDAMRQLSAEMRQEALNRFEARAARLGVILTVPMIIFILPCVFLVVGGPAAVQVIHLNK